MAKFRTLQQKTTYVLLLFLSFLSFDRLVQQRLLSPPLVFLRRNLINLCTHARMHATVLLPWQKFCSFSLGRAPTELNSDGRMNACSTGRKRLKVDNDLLQLNTSSGSKVRTLQIGYLLPVCLSVCLSVCYLFVCLGCCCCCCCCCVAVSCPCYCLLTSVCVCVCV